MIKSSRVREIATQATGVTGTILSIFLLVLLFKSISLRDLMVVVLKLGLFVALCGFFAASLSLVITKPAPKNSSIFEVKNDKEPNEHPTQ
jgi:hypothetical protein